MNFLIYVLGIICAVFVIYDVLTNQKKMKDSSKIIWIIFAILFSIITAIIYLIVKKK